MLDKPLHCLLVALFHGVSQLTIQRHLHLRQVSVHRVQYVPARVCRGGGVGVGAVSGRGCAERARARARKHVECA